MLFWLTFGVAIIGAAATTFQAITNYREQKLQQSLTDTTYKLDSIQKLLRQKENILFLQQNSIDSLRKVLSDKKK